MEAPFALSKSQPPVEAVLVWREAPLSLLLGQLATVVAVNVVPRRDVVVIITVGAPLVGRLALCTSCGSHSVPPPLDKTLSAIATAFGTVFFQEEESLHAPR